MMKPQSKRKVLFITSDKYPCFRPAAKAIFGEELPKRGYTIDWLLQSDERRVIDGQSNIFRYVSTVSGDIYVAPTDHGKSRYHRLRKHALDLVNDMRMLSLAKNRRYDIIQVKDKYLSALLGLVVAKFYKIKFFYWIAFPHGEASLLGAQEGHARYRIFYRIRGWLLRALLYKVIARYADHIFVQSEQMKQDFAHEGVSIEIMTPVPGSIELECVPFNEQAYANTLDIPSDQQVILYLGTLNRMRRLDFVIRVFAKVIKKYPKAILYMIGGGDDVRDEELLKHEAVRLHVEEEIIFTGHIPMKKAWEYIRRADVCLSPYFPTPILMSTSPTKLIEYMAMGRPVVGNDHPEQRLLIDESCAGLCVPWEEQAFADAIGGILSDPDRAEAMGLCGRRYVEMHRTNQIMADVVENRYKMSFSDNTEVN